MVYHQRNLGQKITQAPNLFTIPVLPINIPKILIYPYNQLSCKWPGTWGILLGTRLYPKFVNVALFSLPLCDCPLLVL